MDGIKWLKIAEWYIDNKLKKEEIMFKLFGKFLVGKGIWKACKRAVVAGGSTIGATAVATGDADEVTTALVTVATWLVSLFMDWLKHRK